MRNQVRDTRLLVRPEPVLRDNRGVALYHGVGTHVSQDVVRAPQAVVLHHVLHVRAGQGVDQPHVHLADALQGVGLGEEEELDHIYCPGGPCPHLIHGQQRRLQTSVQGQGLLELLPGQLVVLRVLVHRAIKGIVELLQRIQGSHRHVPEAEIPQQHGGTVEVVLADGLLQEGVLLGAVVGQAGHLGLPLGENPVGEPQELNHSFCQAPPGSYPEALLAVLPPELLLSLHASQQHLPPHHQAL
mmetsp:Transcript_97023/g.222300  ORF Transcript_97023/g.222300 Transcript_97023/m.222300 type:complete len:243 (+) Transcript_97023:1988-2716(+)